MDAILGLGRLMKAIREALDILPWDINFQQSHVEVVQTLLFIRKRSIKAESENVEMLCKTLHSSNWNKSKNCFRHCRIEVLDVGNFFWLCL